MRYDIKEKYLSTPEQFKQYMQQQLGQAENWNEIESKLNTFTGRGWADYSIMLYKALRQQNASTKTFFKYFHKVFSAKGMKRWKYKFYIKCYFPRLFRLLVKLKGG